MVDIDFFISELQRAKKILNPEALKAKLDTINANMETWTPTQIRTTIIEIVPSMIECLKILTQLRSIVSLQIEQVLGFEKIIPLKIRLFPICSWWSDVPDSFERLIKNLNEQNKKILATKLQELREALNDEIDMDKVINEAIKFKNSLTEREIEQLKRAY